MQDLLHRQQHREARPRELRVRQEGGGGCYPLSSDHWSGYNNYSSYLGYNTGMSMTSSTYPSSSLTTYPTTVLDPLLQASSLATAASVQTTSGEVPTFS